MQDSMQQQMPMGTMMNAPMPYQYASAGTSTDRQPQNLCPPDRTLWMGSIDNEKWDAKFITDAFASFGFQVHNVKMVTEKGSDRLASYCFVEFVSEDDARNAMLKANGRTVPNDSSRRRFNLSFANSPESHNEFNLFVNNLSSSIDDVDLFKVFGEKYKSCRGAKVYRNYDGSSKKSGFVRFTSETDQQMALIEMNKVKLNGKELLLKLAHPRGGRTQHTSGRYSGSNKYAGNNNYSSGHSNRTYSSRGKHRSRSPRKSSPPPKKHFTESVDPPTVEEYNEFVYGVDWDFQMAMDSSRFSKYLIPVDTKTDDLAVKLYD